MPFDMALLTEIRNEAHLLLFHAGAEYELKKIGSVHEKTETVSIDFDYGWASSTLKSVRQ